MDMFRIRKPKPPGRDMRGILWNRTDHIPAQTEMFGNLEDSQTKPPGHDMRDPSGFGRTRPKNQWFVISVNRSGGSRAMDFEFRIGSVWSGETIGFIIKTLMICGACDPLGRLSDCWF